MDADSHQKPAPLKAWSMLSHEAENEMFTKQVSTKCLAFNLQQASDMECGRGDARRKPASELPLSPGEERSLSTDRRPACESGSCVRASLRDRTPYRRLQCALWNAGPKHCQADLQNERHPTLTECHSCLAFYLSTDCCGVPISSASQIYVTTQEVMHGPTPTPLSSISHPRAALASCRRHFSAAPARRDQCSANEDRAAEMESRCRLPPAPR